MRWAPNALFSEKTRVPTGKVGVRRKGKSLASAGIRKQKRPAIKKKLKIRISNFHTTNLIVVLNSPVALTAAEQDSFLASNKIV